MDNTKISKHLGKTSKYKSKYDSSLLVREERSSNRVHLKIKDDDLPFKGSDVWNAYEVSALTDSGLPVTGVIKMVYGCTSKYIVESKSFKLYLNSFNMTPLGDTATEVAANIQQVVIKDLSQLLDTEVEVVFATNSQILKCKISPYWEWDHGISNSSSEEHYTHAKDSLLPVYSTIEEDYVLNEVNFTKYQEDPKLLKVVKSECARVCYHSSLLKSNCRVTSQPDWGDVYIYIKKEGETIDPISMLKYIISFRDECHFHEEICETIYKRIWDKLKPEELSVKCLYARRGGIDINPERVSKNSLMHVALSDPKIPHVKTPKQ